MKSTDNLRVYNEVRNVPTEAQKEIKGGRIGGMTDINPMWRIKTLTEQFGMAGVGWYAPIRKQWLEVGSDGNVSAFVNIELFVKVDGEWSMPIDGTGGSSFIAKERNGLYTSDECYKMAYTDAISVACKALGIGADIYWQKDRTKYSSKEDDKEPKQASKPHSKPSPSDKTDLEKVIEKLAEKGIAVESLLLKAKVSSLEELSPAQVKKILEM